MAHEPTPPPSKGDTTRGRILEAAVRCLVDGGIDDVRIARVARRAGVSTALVHYHFETREALLAQALEAAFGIAGELRLTTKYGTGPATTRLWRKLEESLPYPGRRRRELELWVELWLQAMREPALRGSAAAVYARLQDSWATLIREGAEAGEYAAADPDATAARVLALVDGFGVRALLGDPAVPVELARDRVWAALAAELGIPAEPPPPDASS